MFVSWTDNCDMTLMPPPEAGWSGDGSPRHFGDGGIGVSSGGICHVGVSQPGQAFSLAIAASISRWISGSGRRGWSACGTAVTVLLAASQCTGPKAAGPGM